MLRTLKQREFRAELAGLLLKFYRYELTAMYVPQCRPWANLLGLSLTSRQQVSCNIVLTPKLDILSFALVHVYSLSTQVLRAFRCHPDLLLTSTDTILPKISATFTPNFLPKRLCLHSLKAFHCLLLPIRCLCASREQQPLDQVPQTSPEYYFSANTT